MVYQEVIAVIDRSGSMHGKELDTVGGINAMINQLKSTKTKEDTIYWMKQFRQHASKHDAQSFY